MHGWLGLFGIVTAVTVVHVSVMALTVRALGHRLRTVSLFSGPVLVRRRVGNVDLQLGLLPLGGSVQLAAEDGLASVPPVPRMLMLTSSNVVLLVAGLALFGTSGPFLLNRAAFFQLPLHRAMGWAAMAFGVMNLLPLPQLSGGQALAALVSHVLGREVRFAPWLSVLGVLASLLIVGAFVWWLAG
jgi:membrane-associated protease RseP (regulator of RpoE activity)